MSKARKIAAELEALTEQRAKSGSGDKLTQLMSELSAKRDAKKLTRSDIEAANKQLGGKGFEFQSDGKGGFVVQINGMLPDPEELRKRK